MPQDTAYFLYEEKYGLFILTGPIFVGSLQGKKPNGLISLESNQFSSLVKTNKQCYCLQPCALDVFSLILILSGTLSQL